MGRLMGPFFLKVHLLIFVMGMVDSMAFAFDIKKTVEELNRTLPRPWHAEVTETKNLPFQWKGETKDLLGVKVALSNLEKTGKVKKPYDKSGATVTKRAQMIRYLYPHLNAGFDFPIFVRSHPDELEVVTADFVVIRPSFAREESDFEVPTKVKSEFERAFHYPASPTGPAVELVVTEEEQMVDINIWKKSHPDKKALVLRSKGKGRMYLKVMTLK